MYTQDVWPGGGCCLIDSGGHLGSGQITSEAPQGSVRGSSGRTTPSSASAAVHAHDLHLRRDARTDLYGHRPSPVHGAAYAVDS